jgi:histone-lysine N-methyltransferase SETMAR
MLLHENTCPNMADLMNMTQATLGGEIMNHPPYSTDLGPSDFNFFGPMKVHLEGQKFQTVDELRHDALNWLHIQDKATYAAGTSNLP